MRARSWIRWLPLFLLLAACARGEEIQVTVFFLKDGTKIEALSHASAVDKGESVHLITTTAGEKQVLRGDTIASWTKVTRDLSKLPEFTQDRIESRHRVRQEWSERVAAEREAEERERKAALERAGEMAGESRALREAEQAERTIRQRCAALWQAQQAAQGQIRVAQASLERCRSNLRNAEEHLRSLGRGRSGSSEARRSQQRRADAQVDTARDRVRDAERDVQTATKQANESAAQLDKAKPQLAEAEKKLAEARRRYEETRERLTESAAPTPEPAEDEARPLPEEARAVRTTDPEPALAPRYTLVRSGEQGEWVLLDDDSKWEIHPDDRDTAARWLADQEIIIVSDSDPAYANRLVNNVMKMGVKARRVE